MGEWWAWHEQYDNAGSELSRRLAIVRASLRAALAAHGSRELTLLSLCSGKGLDVVPVLAEQRDAARVRARLIDNDPIIVQSCRALVAEANLAGTEVVLGDAALVEHYMEFVPADILLLCGIFGNVSMPDVLQTIDRLPQLCAHGAFVIWTKGRKRADHTNIVRERFRGNGFSEMQLFAPSDAIFTVGVHRFDGAPQPLKDCRRLFSFVTR